MSRQLSLSFELILLFDWFLNGGREKLVKLIKDSVNEEIAKKVSEMSDEDYTEAVDKLHETVLQFVELLEGTLLSSLSEVQETNDGNMITSRINGKNIKKELLKQLLKNWTPDSNDMIN
jgi:SPX domain protein involved in polyphosphate accumulation